MSDMQEVLQLVGPDLLDEAMLRLPPARVAQIEGWTGVASDLIDMSDRGEADATDAAFLVSQGALSLMVSALMEFDESARVVANEFPYLAAGYWHRKRHPPT